MLYVAARCETGCCRQAALVLGPVQLEVAYTAKKLNIGAMISSSRNFWLAGKVFFGPFSFAVALRRLAEPAQDE